VYSLQLKTSNLLVHFVFVVVIVKLRSDAMSMTAKATRLVPHREATPSLFVSIFFAYNRSSMTFANNYNVRKSK